MRLVFYCFVLIAVQVNAQNSGLELFTEGGENFTLMINGVRKNATPTTNVKVTDLSVDGVKIKVVFEKPIPEMNRYIVLTPGDLSTFAIRKNKNGEYALRMVSTSPLASSTPQPEPKVQTLTTTSPATQTVQSTTSVSTTSTSSHNTADNVSINMNINAMGINANAAVTESQPEISVSITAGSPPATATTITTTTVTSSSYTSSSTSVDSHNASNPSVSSECSLSAADQDAIENSVKSKSFADVKLTTLKQAIKNQCVSASQVKSFADLLEFEEDKLDFAKYAYDYTSDKKNYYKVNDTFRHESTIADLATFLNSKD